MTTIPTAADDLAAALEAGVIDQAGYERLTAFLAGRAAPTEGPVASPVVRPAAARFDLTHVLWYAGALIVMAAMGLFTNAAFNALGGYALTSIAIAYAVSATWLGRILWRRGLTVPGGLLVTIGVAMVPLAIYGIQDALNLWRFAQGNPGEYKNFFPYVHGSWIYMELGTVLAAVVAVRFFPFPFIVFVGSAALWFMSMDIAVYFVGTAGDEWAVRREVSRVFGIAMILCAWLIDLTWARRGDFAFWLHLFGAAALWGGLTFTPSSTEFLAAVYCLINVGFVLASVYFGRRVYAVFGAAGIAFYLGHLASAVFRDAITFSFALSAVGLAIIGLGLLYRRNRDKLAAWLDTRLPEPLRLLRPKHLALP